MDCSSVKYLDPIFIKGYVVFYYMCQMVNEILVLLASEIY